MAEARSIAVGVVVALLLIALAFLAGDYRSPSPELHRNDAVADAADEQVSCSSDYGPAPDEEEELADDKYRDILARKAHKLDDEKPDDDAVELYEKASLDELSIGGKDTRTTSDQTIINSSPSSG